MIPDSFKPSVPSKKDFELLPDDTYQVVISNIDYKEQQPVYQSTTEFEDKLNFEFTIVEEGPYKGRKLWKETNTVMKAGNKGYSPSNLYKLFCAVNRVKLQDEEAQSVVAKDINAMVGKELRLVVKIEPNQKGEDKNKVKDMLPLKVASVPSLAVNNEPLPLDPMAIPIGEDINVDDIPF